MSHNLHAELFGLGGVPLIRAGDDLSSIICNSMVSSGFGLNDHDVVVVAQKVVSIAEGRLVPFASVTPSSEAHALAEKTSRDPRFCQLVIDESKRILYLNQHAIITEDKLGFVNTSAGIDRSNSGSREGEIAVLLPLDPDASAERIRDALRARFGKQVAVIISDSFGRPFRKGSVGMAIGIAGITALEVADPVDLAGRQIHIEEARVDELAAAACALMGQAAEQRPVVIVRGFPYRRAEEARLQDLLRPPAEDQVWPEK